jgi:hypothetical protein
MDRRYQLIHPYVGHKIYNSKTPTSGAKKCYTDLKIDFVHEKVDKIDAFMIKDIDSKEIFTFKIHKPLSKFQENENILKLVGDDTNNNDITNTIALTNINTRLDGFEKDIFQIKSYLRAEKQIQLQKQNNECIIS